MNQFPMNGPFPKEIKKTEEEKDTYVVVDYKENIINKRIKDTSGKTRNQSSEYSLKVIFKLVGRFIHIQTETSDLKGNYGTNILLHNHLQFYFVLCFSHLGFYLCCFPTPSECDGSDIKSLWTRVPLDLVSNAKDNKVIVQVNL